MPTPSKATGSGTKAFISTDGTAFQEFASVTKLGGPSMSRGTVDVTDMNSFTNNNQFKEFLNDFIEADEIPIEGFVLQTDVGRTAAETAFYAGSTVYIKLQLPAAIGQTMLITGIMTKYQPIGDISTDAGIAFAISVKPTAKPTLSATTT